MSSTQDLVTAVLRWIHVLAGVAWIGHLYFFNWVNGPFQSKVDAATKQRVNPELLPRALFWFRWGAAWTWITGFLLLFLVYYHGGELLQQGLQTSDPVLYGALTKPDSGLPTVGTWMPGLVSLLIGFVVFDLLFRFLKTGTHQLVGAVVWGAAVIGMGCVLGGNFHFGDRAVFVHMGAILGTVMAANVWMRIWPAQRRILTAVKAGQAPDAKDVALAGQRSRANTYMSVPLLLLMVSNHHSSIFNGSVVAWPWATAILFAASFLLTYWLYKVAAKVPGF